VPPLLLFVITTSGAELKPCPTVASSVALPVYKTIEKPAVVLICTVEVIDPLLFEAVVPALHFHCHATLAIPF
jgi:hypothetical protein